MTLKETLRSIVKSQKAELATLERGIEREELSKIDPKLPFAIVLSGIRRCGKSTILRQIMAKIKNFYYFNFDDPRATNFKADDFQKLDEVFTEEYGKSDFYFFDEIQNAEKWELFVRKLIDSKKHVIITGSNASLLSRELGTRLTGRHLRHELFPFSFKEFLSFTEKKPGLESFDAYFLKGGFPEYLATDRANVLQELFNDIIMRDIAIRYKLRNVKTLKELALYLLTNTGKEFSYNNLKKLFNLGSTNSIIAFISHFEDAYLIFTVPKFDYSFKKQLVNPKKVYSIDNGLSNVNSASFSEDKGRMLENLVFITLRNKNKEIFYFKGKNECDFVIKEKAKIIQAIQVCYSIDEDNKDRELNGLLEALKELKLQQGFILTYNQEEEITINNKKIKIMPLWKWLMER